MLHVTPGAVSQQIKLLESAMKVALVRRVGREVALTEAGLRLATRLSDLFDRIETVVDEVMDTVSPRRLRLKVLPSFAIKWLVPRLASFYVAHGDIDLEIATVGRAEELHLDKADFVVRHGAGDWTDVHVERLFDDAFVPVCVPALAQTLGVDAVFCARDYQWTCARARCCIP